MDPGDSIAEGRWIINRLGGGSRYEVFLVWDERLFALMVAKILRPGHVHDGRALRVLRQEAEVLEKLAHPVLLRGYGSFFDGPFPHLLLEHIEGPTLNNLIHRHGCLPLEQLLPLALHMAAALHYLSLEGIVHLDVKPGNIMMGIPPRLIDLSITRSIERARQIRVPIGTDPYMAPEQCDPKSFEGCIGPAADVWGLGATLYHVITGKRPFNRQADARDSINTTVRFPQLVEEPLPFPKSVPVSLASLIFRMLDKNPAKRPTPAEIPSILEPLVEGLPGGMRVTKLGFRDRYNSPKNIPAPSSMSDPNAKDGGMLKLK